MKMTPPEWPADAPAVDAPWQEWAEYARTHRGAIDLLAPKTPQPSEPVDVIADLTSDAPGVNDRLDLAEAVYLACLAQKVSGAKANRIARDVLLRTHPRRPGPA